MAERKMRLAVRAHDVAAPDAASLCKALIRLGVRDVQLVSHKSFPGFDYSEEAVRALADTLRAHHVRVAVYGCYIDPVSREGRARFLNHIRYAALLGAQVIATETGTVATEEPCSEQTYSELVCAFRSFVEKASEYSVTVAAEAVAVHPIATPEWMLRLLDDVPGLAAVFDPDNLRLRADGGVDPAVRALHLYDGRIAAVHWKQTRPGVDLFVRDWLEAHPDVPLITEGLMGEELRDVLLLLGKKETVQKRSSGRVCLCGVHDAFRMRGINPEGEKTQMVKPNSDTCFARAFGKGTQDGRGSF